MGFGFVVARFGLFLRELASLRTLPQFQTSALSVPLGTALLVAGVLVNILSSVRHVRIVRALNTGAPLVTKPSTMAIVVALVLAAAGLAMAIYLRQQSKRLIGKELAEIWQRNEYGSSHEHDHWRRNYQQTEQVFGARNAASLGDHSDGEGHQSLSLLSITAAKPKRPD
jgi:putative membrane protein